MTAVDIVLALAGLALVLLVFRMRAQLAESRRSVASAYREVRAAKEHLDSVRASEERLSLAVERLPVGVAAFDAQGTVLFANAHASRFVAARHGEAVVELRIRALVAAVVETGTAHGGRSG